MIVGFDNVLHQLVTDHVTLVEIYELNALDVAQNLPHLDQAGDPLRRQIHLSDITGHNHLGMEPEPREEHLHLLRRGILRFVKNDERIVQRTASHKTKWRNFNVTRWI